MTIDLQTEYAKLGIEMGPKVRYEHVFKVAGPSIAEEDERLVSLVFAVLEDPNSALQWFLEYADGFREILDGSDDCIAYLQGAECLVHSHSRQLYNQNVPFTPAPYWKID